MESVRDSMPLDLKLRLTLGRAVESLSRLKAGLEVADRTTFSDAADALGKLDPDNKDEVPAAGRSLGEYADWRELVTLVRAPESAIGTELEPVVNDLRQLGRAEGLDPQRLLRVHGILRDLRHELAHSRWSATDRVVR